MDKAGGQEGARQGRGALGRRAGPGQVHRVCKAGGGGCSLVSWVEGREQREAVGDPQLHRLRSRSEGGMGGPAWVWRPLEGRVDTTSRWLESTMGRGVSTQHIPGRWSEQWGECGGRASLGTETLRSADISGQLR